MTDHIVVGDRVLLDASFAAAGARLGMLARDGMLLRASEVAYGEGIAGLVKVAGPAAGLTRLAGVRLGNLAETDDCAHIAFQWEAIAADGKLFTALDADLMLVPTGDQITALALAEAYWPQPGQAGARAGPGDRAARRQSAASWAMWHVRSSTRARQDLQVAARCADRLGTRETAAPCPDCVTCEPPWCVRSAGVARRAPGGPPKAEPGADAGPAAPQASRRSPLASSPRAMAPRPP